MNKEKILNLLNEIKKELLSNNEDFSYLKNLLFSDAWPQAAESYQIADSSKEEDKIERAQNLIDIYLPNITNKKFLDFGCGEGFLVKESLTHSPLKSIGYDIEKQGNLPWEDENLLLTTDFNKVKLSGPYDIILLYDVLDHASDPIKTLNLIKEVCTSESRILVRNHPWCSRHGGHYYEKINKAFIHLVFSNEELINLGLIPGFINAITRPLMTYSNYFKLSNFSIVEEHVVKQEVEEFFYKNNVVKNRILQHWEGQDVGDFPLYQMSQNFIDYELKIK